MARGDGIHRTNARNMRLTAAKIGNVQQHNERERNPMPIRILYRRGHNSTSISRNRLEAMPRCFKS